MRRRRLIPLALCLVCVLLLTSCAPRELTEKDLRLGPLRLGMTDAELEKVMGQPATTEKRKTIGYNYQFNTGPDSILRVMTDDKGAFAITLLRVSEGLKGTPSLVSAKELRTPRGIALGVSETIARKKYGPSAHDYPGYYYKLLVGGAPADWRLLQFTVENGFVTGIHLTMSSIGWNDEEPD